MIPLIVQKSDHQLSSTEKSASSDKAVILAHTPRHSPQPGEQSRPALRHEHLIVEQPVLQEHLMTSSKAFGATSLSVIIGINRKFPTPASWWQIKSSPCLYLVVNSKAEVSGCCRCQRQCT